MADITRARRERRRRRLRLAYLLKKKAAESWPWQYLTRDYQ